MRRVECIIIFSSLLLLNSITVYFIDRDGEKRLANAKLGSNLLDVALDNNIDLEGFGQKIFLKFLFNRMWNKINILYIGACEGTLSCSTCHLILDENNYNQLKPPNDEENDMLDLAFGLKKTSRLGCQITVTENMKDWVFVVPKEVSDARK